MAKGDGVRFGAVMTTAPAGTREWHDRVRRVDDLGFDVLLLPDHLGMMSPFPPLACAAAVSDRLRLGVQVCNVCLWNPAMLARDAATVDLLSDGRLELGLEAGHAQQEFMAVRAVRRRAGSGHGRRPLTTHTRSRPPVERRSHRL